MNELALFAGIGGGILAGKLLGWRTVCAVERDAYAAQVLAQRQNDGNLEIFPIWSDVCSFDGKAWRGLVDVVSGGFPCQDISTAGNGAGIDGEKSGLWTEMFRIICDVRPRFVFMENSPALTSRGLGRVLGDLASERYDAEWCVLGAGDCEAWHERERIWILARDKDANIDCLWKLQQTESGNKEGHGSCLCDTPSSDAFSVRREKERLQSGESESVAMLGESAQNVADSCFDGCGQMELEHSGREAGPGASNQVGERLIDLGKPSWWSIEPDVVRMVHGSAFRVDKIRGLGNIQVPVVAATAFCELVRRFLI